MKETPAHLRNHATPRRSATLVLGLALLMIVPLVPAGAVSEESPAGRAADWIAREYDSADSEIEAFGTGALIDAMVSLAITETELDTAADMLDELATEAAGYAGSGEDFSPGAAGKLVHILHVYGENPADFVDGRDFESELRASMQTTGVDTGRFGEATVFAQALGVLGLAMTEAGVPDAATTWLVGKQCEDGDFTFDATCPGYGDADTTGLVAVALFAAGATDAAQAAVDHLRSVQETGGGVPGYGNVNANSTAMAAQAFTAAGEDALAAEAEAFLETLQFDGSHDPSDAGGLRYLPADDAANTFATIQGIWGMGAPELFDLEAPSLRFTDTAGSVFADDIEWIAESGITRGCNPPVNDEYCPDADVNRGEMAAFLRRARQLAPAAPAGFQDVGDSVFADDIDAIAAAGITLGCNPPQNDEYCPDETVTRGQMAAFLARAFDVPASGAAPFADVENSVFADDIAAIAAAGITLGCNPPQNDEFCPEDPVTRGQMAAFIRRAMSS